MTRAIPSSLAALGLGLMLVGCGGSAPAGGVFETPATITLLDVQAEIFTPRCALSGCHTGTSAPFGLNLGSASASAANLIDVNSGEIPALARIEPFEPASSYLYLKITADPVILGDPMPASGPPLTAGEIALIRSWIEQGAL